MTDWKNKKQDFTIIDVRTQKGNFLPSILSKAKKIAKGDGLCIVQSFEPIPLYSALGEMGFEHETDKISEIEYRVYFHKITETDKILENNKIP